MSNRILKLNSLIKETLGPIIFELVDQKPFNLITIIDVETAPDLTSCRVWMSSFINQENLLAVLAKHVYEIQQRLNRSLSLRKVPKIIFKLDQGGIHSERINDIIKNF